MSSRQIKYELLHENSRSSRHRHIYIQVCLLVALCAISSVAVFLTWTVIYRKQVNVPSLHKNIPDDWPKRSQKYAQLLHDHQNRESHQPVLGIVPETIPTVPSNASEDMPVPFQYQGTTVYKRFENELIYPSRLGNFIYKTNETETKLVCYYLASSPTKLSPNDVHPHLCTHINVGMVWIANHEIVLEPPVLEAIRQVNALKSNNPALKVLIWIGGADATGFPEMVANHANRMQFIRSLKRTLEDLHLDGVDIDWEFPTTSQRERLHFTQLLHEIRREYQRERRTYLLTVATAAPEGIVYFAYDVKEMNEYVDYINVMTYDFHAFSRWTPFTGLNAPLYRRPDENSFLATLNINASVHYWRTQGMDMSKIVIGLPTYGHSFKLVNSFHRGLNSPASGFGDLGSLGFVTYSDVCWFQKNNYLVQYTFDATSCSPYMSAGFEWVSYENEQSVSCKAAFIKANGFGGAMVFALNTDDIEGYCDSSEKTTDDLSVVDCNKRMFGDERKFPLVRKIRCTLKSSLH